MILVDSSVYIRWLRTNTDPVARLADALRRHEVATCGVVRAEVLRGIVSPAAHQRMQTLFAVMHELPTDRKAWEDAENLAWQLDRQGIVLPLTDIVIAACALRINATVVTTDRHFSQVPGLLVRTDV